MIFSEVFEISALVAVARQISGNVARKSSNRPFRQHRQFRTKIGEKRDGNLAVTRLQFIRFGPILRALKAEAHPHVWEFFRGPKPEIKGVE